MPDRESEFLTGEAADERIREMVSDPEAAELVVEANRSLDNLLKYMGFDPATMEQIEGES